MTSHKAIYPILFSKSFNKNLVDFGIEIPLKDERANLTFGLLKEKFQDLEEIENLELLNSEDLLRVHNKEFVSNIFGTHESLESEIIKAYELVDKNGNNYRYNPENASKPLYEMFPYVHRHASGSFYGMQVALKTQFAYVLAGGMHHGMSFGGRGFCMFNDIIVGLRKLQANNKIKNALIIDVDAHKGDGQAELTRNDDSIFTFSIHQKNHWPLDEEEFDKEGNQYPWYIPSDLDVALTLEDDYLKLLEGALDKIKQVHAQRKFDICIVVNGADPYEKDIIPSAFGLKLSLDQMLERDLMIFNFLSELKIPQTYLMAGGYGVEVYKVYYQFLDYLISNRLVGKHSF